MAAITWSTVEGFAAELSVVPLVAQTIILGMVNAWFDAALFGGEGSDELTMRRVLMAAHLGTIHVPGSGAGSQGPVTSESGGGLSVSYANMMTPDGMASTGYGRTMAMLSLSSPARGGWLL